MKYFFFVVLFGALLSGCENGSSNTAVDIETSTNIKGVEIVNTGDRYDSEEGMYRVHATIKSTGKQTLRNIRFKATYYDAQGNELAKSNGEVNDEIKPGDKDVVETTYLFPTAADMPTRVVLTAENPPASREAI